jgi:hypothetical protein
MDVINEKVLNFRLTKGYSAETSGGILCMIESSKVKDFVNEHRERFGQDTWIVGEVTKSQTPNSPKAILREDLEIISIKESFLHTS